MSSAVLCEEKRHVIPLTRQMGEEGSSSFVLAADDL
jgi:hypothetical protein